MSFLQKAKEAAQLKIIELSLTTILFLTAWLLTEVGEPIWDAISKQVPMKSVLPLLALSLVVNIILACVLYLLVRKPDLQLRYGIYWDKEKNPYCPLCEKPVHYGDWHLHGWGYYCRPCDVITPLQDASGNKIEPNAVFSK